MVQKNFYKNKYFRSIAKKKLTIKKLFVKNDWIAHHGIERSGTNYLRAILIILKINLINQFDPAENHPTHKHFRWYTDKLLIPSLKKSLINNQIQNLKNKSLNCKMINVQDLKNMKENLLALYPSVGENLDYINSNNLKNISFLYRKIDQYSWKYCNKGFFNFKNYIPKMIQELI